MARLYLTPSKIAKELAEEINMDVDSFIARNNYNVNNSESRACSKYGDYFQDFLIQRNDGSFFSIHEVQSECEGLKKLIITLYGELQHPMPNEITAYLDGIDYEKLQHDPNYLNVFGDGLLAEKRISDKYTLSQIGNRFDVPEIYSIAYLGMVAPDKNNPGKYVKGAYNYSEMLNYIISNRKRVAQEKEQKSEEQQARKEKLKNAIYTNIANADLNKLESVARILGIDLSYENNIPGNNTPTGGR